MRILDHPTTFPAPLSWQESEVGDGMGGREDTQRLSLPLVSRPLSGHLSNLSLASKPLNSSPDTPTSPTPPAQTLPACRRLHTQQSGYEHGLRD